MAQLILILVLGGMCYVTYLEGMKYFQAEKRKRQAEEYERQVKRSRMKMWSGDQDFWK